MNIIWGGSKCPELNDAIAEFVARHIDGCERGFGEHVTMGVVENEVLVAGVVYHNWSPDAGVIELSSASDSKRWLTRPVLKAMFGYPFDQIGCQMVVLRVSEHNANMCRIARAYGFDEVAVPRLRGRNEAEIIFTLTDDAWRANRFHKKGLVNG